MDYPLGEMIGNANEMWEVVSCLDKDAKEWHAIMDRIECDPKAPGFIKLIDEVKSNKDILVFVTLALCMQMAKMSGQWKTD